MFFGRPSPSHALLLFNSHRSEPIPEARIKVTITLGKRWTAYGKSKKQKTGMPAREG